MFHRDNFQMHRQVGFTLVELLVCLGIVAALLGMGLPVMAATQRRADRNATRLLVQAVAAAVAQYPLRMWTVSYDDDGDDANRDGLKDSAPNQAATPPHQRSGRIFDCNESSAGPMAGDGLIDGVPGVSLDAEHDGPYWSETIRSGYGGFLAMTHLPVAPRHIKNGRLVDSWKHPLRIAWAAEIYGPNGFGVWSAGSDGIDGTADDLCSWNETHE